MKSLQCEFGYVMSGKSLIVGNVSCHARPEETIAVQHAVSALLEGALLVYLFATWESHVPQDVATWLTAQEREELDAFAHVRDSVAHKYQGERADFARKRQAFERQMPFAGILWDTTKDRIDISQSSAAMHCYQLMQKLTQQLVVRLHVDQRP
ncbi:MAG: hypothetical protein EON93_05095 [Burkholderiales bacterium]|nr:MAG: hypothetical protein EON93_05095 [Burkholderiales bacterium]